MTITYSDAGVRLAPAMRKAKGAISLGISLQDRAVLSLKPAHRGMEIAVAEGRVWLTQQGDPTDYLLAAGETFTTKAPGLIVVEALAESGVRLSERAGRPS